MAYVAVKGGKQALEEAEKLIGYYRRKGGSLPVSVKQIRDQMRLAVDRVMGEGSLYAPDLAALALKQSEGDVLEASFLLRAFRSTLPGNGYSLPIDTTQMHIARRLSAAFKEIPGGQYLGPTYDYTKRLLQFDLLEEDEEHMRAFLLSYLSEQHKGDEAVPSFPKVIDWLRQEGLLSTCEEAAPPANQTVDDVTRQPLRLPASRAMRLQSLTRGETGALMAFAYSSIRGYGNAHPTLGELRAGFVKVVIPHPLLEGESITIGRIEVTEAEIIARMEERADNRSEKPKAKFSLGYGLCFGQNEIKAISMGILDRTMVGEGAEAPAEDEEFVLYHIDGIEASGFVSHLKLPHYVDFQADMNRLRSIRARREKESEQ